MAKVWSFGSSASRLGTRGFELWSSELGFRVWGFRGLGLAVRKVAGISRAVEPDLGCPVLGVRAGEALNL